MNEKSSIRLLLIGVAAALVVGGGIGFFAGTRKSWSGYEERIELLQEKNETLLAQQKFWKQQEEAPQAEAAQSLKVVEPEGFVLLEEDGFVVVYQADRKTHFSATGILVENLPEEVQEEVRKGKVIEGEEQLYNFLESYSS